MSLPRFIRNDDYLKPYGEIYSDLQDRVNKKKKELLQGRKRISDFANGHLFFGLHKEGNELVFREWAPNAAAIWLISNENAWIKHDHFRFKRTGPGIWELRIDAGVIPHNSLYRSHGREVKVNAFLHGPRGLFRTIIQRYSTPRHGSQIHTYGRTKPPYHPPTL